MQQLPYGLKSSIRRISPKINVHVNFLEKLEKLEWLSLNESDISDISALNKISWISNLYIIHVTPHFANTMLAEVLFKIFCNHSTQRSLQRFFYKILTEMTN